MLYRISKKGKNAKQRKLSLGDFLPIHFSRVKPVLSPRWFREKEIIFNAHIIPYFCANHPLQKFDRKTIEQYRTDRLKKVSPATVNRELSCLLKMLRHAVELDMLDSRYVPMVKKMRETRGRLRYLSTDEIERLLIASKEYGNAMEAYVMLMTFAGLRSSEALYLRWIDVALNHNAISIVKFDDIDDLTGDLICFEPKSHQNRSIPLIPRLRDYLLRRNETTEGSRFVIRGKDRVSFYMIKRDFNKIVKQVGLETSGENKVTAHTCRHTFASHLVMNGCSLYDVSKLLGHTTIQVTERYSHLSQTHLQDTIKRIVF